MKNRVGPVSISAIIILLWMIPELVRCIQGEGYGAGIWGLFSIAGILATVIALIISGWQTRDVNILVHLS